MPDALTEILIPEDAPFNETQREWLNGYLTGLLDQFTSADNDPPPTLPVTVIWGSQTGTAEGLASKFAKQGRSSGLDPKVIDASEYPFEQLASEQHLIVITSTYGDGEAPDNMVAFYNALHSGSAPKLKNLQYSILSIGDSSYPDFCQCGIDLDQRLQELGASRIIPRVDCDLELDEDFAVWSKDLISALGQVATAETEEKPTGYDKNNPFTSKILNNVNLNEKESEKSTHHLELCLQDSGLEYEVGDALGVFPVNCPDLVQAILNLLPFEGSESVLDGQSLQETLSTQYEIRNLTLPIFKAWAQATQDPDLLTLSEDKAEASSFIWGRDIIDLLKDHPINFKSADDFLAILKKLAPRLYSISSSPKAHPDAVHITVGLVQYQSNGLSRKGVCSSYLAENSHKYPPRVFIHSNKAFRPPSDPTIPIIMVGPGTGIAPFRAFLEERRATQATGKNWLFFGNPHIATDYLYKDELENFQKEGYLHQLSTAFSRDQEEKIYVQHLMEQHGRELFEWLENGACFYVCGDASRMAKDVDQALHQIIEIHGERSAEDAAQYIQDMKQQKRYCRDVY